MDIQKLFPGLSPKVFEITKELHAMILEIFPDAVISNDKDNIGFGYGTGYKDLVFVISPYRAHVNLGIVGGAGLPDPHGLMSGGGKVHRHVKLQDSDQLKNPKLKEIMIAALQAAQDR